MDSVKQQIIRQRLTLIKQIVAKDKRGENFFFNRKTKKQVIYNKPRFIIGGY